MCSFQIRIEYCSQKRADSDSSVSIFSAHLLEYKNITKLAVIWVRMYIELNLKRDEWIMRWRSIVVVYTVEISNQRPVKITKRRTPSSCGRDGFHHLPIILPTRVDCQGFHRIAIVVNKWVLFCYRDIVSVNLI